MISLSINSPIFILKDMLTNLPARKGSISSPMISMSKSTTLADGGLISIFLLSMEDRDVAEEPIIWFMASQIADR